jgi:predicted transcriptional regulator of viral defense system
MVKETIRNGLSPAEAKALSELSKEGKEIFSITELAEKTGSRGRAMLMASRLARKRWVSRLGKGIYLIMELGAGSRPEWTADSYYIASKFAKPYYIGFYNMLNDYGWTEQVPLSVCVATTKPARARTIHGVRYDFICLSKKKFFGTIRKSVSGHGITVSDPEKTLVDALDHPEYCGGISEVAKAIFNARGQADWSKVATYAAKQGNGAVLKRLGYIAEVMDVELPERLRKEILGKLTSGYPLLSPGAKASGRHDSKWGLLINTKISKESVLA